MTSQSSFPSSLRAPFDGLRNMISVECCANLQLHIPYHVTHGSFLKTTTYSGDSTEAAKYFAALKSNICEG